MVSHITFPPQFADPGAGSVQARLPVLGSALCGPALLPGAAIVA
ncbi:MULTISPECIES: hypothetical protein [unclassified Nocardiopsis]|nr:MULTISPECIES: hypothetical protein [unclassified Nocardiopsis]